MSELPESVLVTRSVWSARIADYYELMKPRLSALVMLTVAVGFLAGSSGELAAGTLVIVLLGVGLASCGGAVWNQVLEVDVDARMGRTRNRPLPASRVSTWHAGVFGTLLAAGGLVLLACFASPLVFLLTLSATLLYLLVYTPMKRWSTLNTLAGAVPGALPPLIGWVAATGEWTAGGWVLFGIQFVWQIPHFLALAWMYRSDYDAAGMRMLSGVDASGNMLMRQALLYAAALVPVSLLPSFIQLTGNVYAVVAVVLGLLFLGACWRMARLRTRSAAVQAFLASIAYLPCLYGAMLADRLVP